MFCQYCIRELYEAVLCAVLFAITMIAVTGVFDVFHTYPCSVFSPRKNPTVERRERTIYRNSYNKCCNFIR